MSDLTEYYRSMVELYKHFYDKRTEFLIAYVTGISLTSVAIFQYPDIPALCIILIFVSLLALFLDLYLHKRVMISGSVLRDLEAKFEHQYDYNLEASDTKSISRNTIGIMSQVCSVRWDSSFTGRTGGRYFWTYGSGTIVISFAVYFLFITRLIENNTVENYLHILFFTIFLITYLVTLYRVILKAKGYEYILKDLTKYHQTEELYDKFRPYFTLRTRHLHYEKCHFNESNKWIHKPTDKYRDTIQKIIERFDSSQEELSKKIINKAIKDALDLSPEEKCDIFFWWYFIVCLSFLLIIFPPMFL